MDEDLAREILNENRPKSDPGADANLKQAFLDEIQSQFKRNDTTGLFPKLDDLNDAWNAFSQLQEFTRVRNPITGGTFAAAKAASHASLRELIINKIPGYE